MTLAILCALTEHLPSSYLFDTTAADCNKLAHATIGDLLEDLAEDHHVECGCAFSVGKAVWAVSCPATDEAVGALTPCNTLSLPLHTPLSVLDPSLAGSITLLVSTDASTSSALPDLLISYRSKRFELYQSANARVYQRFGDNSQLPTLDLSNYEDICGTRGMTFVDKLEYVYLFLDHFASSRLAVVRRPKGFGKTTFLATLESFFDVVSIHAYFPFMYDGHELDPFVGSAHRRLLVLMLDFERLQLHDNMTPDEVDVECDRFLEQVASNFYFKYAPYLGEYGALQGECDITLEATLGAARAEGHQLFLSVDSYTAPTLFNSPGLVQLVGENILALMSDLINSGLIRCGAMFGDTVPSVAPWTGAGYYDNYTNDLSDDPAFCGAIGFTHDEVEVLGQALSIKLSSHIAPGGDPDGGVLPSTTVYCAADVLSLAHSLLSDNLVDDERRIIPTFTAPLLEPASSDSDESMDYYPLEDDNGDANALPGGAKAVADDENISALANAAAPFPEPKYLDGSDYETLWYAFVGSKHPNAKPPPDIDLEKLARISGAYATPAKSDISSPRGSASTRSYHSFMSTLSADSESSDPPASPTDERKIRP